MNCMIKFMVFFVFSFVLQAHALNFTIQDLGTLANKQSQPTAINQINWVAGTVKDNLGETVDFVWEEEKGLLCLTHKTALQSPLMNNQNIVAGLFWHTNLPHWFFGSKTKFKQIYLRYPHGSFENIGFPDKWTQQILAGWQTPSVWDEKEIGLIAFNDQNQLLICNALKKKNATQFAIWQNGHFKYIDPAVLSKVYTMNNDGLLLGRIWKKENGASVPMLVLYDLENNRTFEIMKDVNLINRDLNDDGEVIFVQKFKNDSKGYFWSLGKGLTELDGFLPYLINNQNQMVGVKVINETDVPFFWQNGDLFSLNEELNLGAADNLWQGIEKLSGMNDQGNVIGIGLFEGKEHAFLIKVEGLEE